MSVVDAVIVGCGLAGAALQAWYFLGSRPPRARRARAPAQEFAVTVGPGFTPDTLVAEAGHPIRLFVFRGDDAPFAARLEFDSLDINVPLEEFAVTTVDVPPANPGAYRFRCGPRVEGHLVVQTGGEAARANLGRGHQKHG